ncbi:MAG: hypothetical protein L3J16_01115 [Anaerolineales bacterium]|nr:hypothetical protein [Anaerolineales bacterium]
MEFPKNETLPPPPGVISSLKSGFDATATHITAIFLPVALDIFLWFGPHLKAGAVLEPLIAELKTMAASGGEGVVDAQRLQEVWAFFQDVNLISMLRTFPIGITSLMNSVLPSNTPLGEPHIIQIGSSFTMLLWIGGLTLAGWIGGGIYFTWTASTVLAHQENFLVWAGKSVLNASLLSLIWLGMVIFLGVPGILMYSLFFIISPLLAQGVVLFLAFFAMWLIVPIFFSVHGIFTKGENAFRSILSSLHMSRFTLPTSSLFVFGVFVLSQGFNFLWSAPADSSWMMLIAIFGHAFITTALLAASFVYYHDMNAWLQVVLAQMNANTTTSAQV